MHRHRGEGEKTRQKTRYWYRKEHTRQQTRKQTGEKGHSNETETKAKTEPHGDLNVTTRATHRWMEPQPETTHQRQLDG